MKNTLKNSDGFGALHALLVLIVLGLVGFMGWYVWNASQEANKNLDSSLQNDTSANSTKKSEQADAYKDWETCNDPEEKVSFRYPSEWGGDCHYEGMGEVSGAFVDNLLKAPSNFRVTYTAGLNRSQYSGSTKPNTVLDVTPLATTFNGKQLYAVLFADEWTDEGKAMLMVLTDTKYTASQKVTVTSVHSASRPGTFISMDANLDYIDHEYGQRTVSEYKQNPDYKNVIKIFESLKSN